MSRVTLSLSYRELDYLKELLEVESDLDEESKHLPDADPETRNNCFAVVLDAWHRT